MIRKKTKSGSVVWIKKRCDELWRNHVKRNQVCFFSNLGDCLTGGSYHFEAAHLVARSQSARIMYHPDNGVCACPRHHAMLDNKVKGAGLCWREVERNLPGVYEKLLLLSQTKTPIKKWEWEEIYESLKLL